MAQAVKILKKHRLRITQFRQDVIQIFVESDHALSSADLENRLVNPDRITLYRTLRSFEEKGIIHKAVDGTQTPKFALCDDACDEHNHFDGHIHFYCEKCENTFCLEDVEIPDVSLPPGYVQDHIDMVIKGTCDKCQE